jgi:hypothetical protein
LKVNKNYKIESIDDSDEENDDEDDASLSYEEVDSDLELAEI